MLTIRQLSCTALFAITASAIAVSPAEAQPDQHVPIHETFSESFDACGTNVRFEQKLDGQYLSDTHPDGTVLTNFQNRSNILWTNADTGKTLTENFIFNYNSKLTPNADGTTLVEIFPQNDQWFDSAGKLVGHLAGIARNVLVFDQNGHLVSVTSVSHGNINNSTDFCTLIDLTK
ncbi:hypothetical protein ACWEK5_46025 [Rhodococcus koreensis]